MAFFFAGVFCFSRRRVVMSERESSDPYVCVCVHEQGKRRKTNKRDDGERRSHFEEHVRVLVVHLGDSVCEGEKRERDKSGERVCGFGSVKSYPNPRKRRSKRGALI